MKICRESIYSLLGLFAKGWVCFMWEQLEQSQISWILGSRAYRSPANSSLSIRTTSLKVKDHVRHLQTVVQLLSKPLSRRLTEDEENFQRIKGVWAGVIQLYNSICSAFLFPLLSRHLTEFLEFYWAPAASCLLNMRFHRWFMFFVLWFSESSPQTAAWNPGLCWWVSRHHPAILLTKKPERTRWVTVTTAPRWDLAAMLPVRVWSFDPVESNAALLVSNKNIGLKKESTISTYYKRLGSKHYRR